ncbi:RNI-like superfamily protein [Artemisia annua]|uniref:RNI-like superfamily protein n=1 Tax=Artemisia annua TaxID=35608 RepID=A0A2U1L439_ARTAN|nr:RNI-like superfamily protein [Artemisia annua]
MGLGLRDFCYLWFGDLIGGSVMVVSGCLRFHHVSTGLESGSLECLGAVGVGGSSFGCLSCVLTRLFIDSCISSDMLEVMIMGGVLHRDLIIGCLHVSHSYLLEDCIKFGYAGRPLLPLHVFTSFNKLHTLTLTVIGNVYTSAESTVDQSATSDSRLSLRLLSLNGICSTDYQVSYLWNNVCYENLTRLVFEKCEGLSDVYAFSRFLKGLVNLNEVELKTCRSIVGLVLFKLSEMSSENLSSLLIYDGGNKEGLLHFIREARCELRELDLRLPLDLVDTHLSGIGARFRKLRVLRLQSCSMVTGEGIRGLGLGLSDHLEELSLTNCDVIKRQSGVLVDLAQSLRRIKVLDLSYNHMLVDKEFVSMISSYGDLRELKVRGCGRLTDVSLTALCRSCKRLESVDIVFCHGIRVEGVEIIILNCKELRKIQVEEHKLSEDARKWMRWHSIQTTVTILMLATLVFTSSFKGWAKMLLFSKTMKLRVRTYGMYLLIAFFDMLLKMLD